MRHGNPYASPPQVEPLEAEIRQLMRDHPQLAANGFWSAAERSAEPDEFIAARKAMLAEDFTRQVVDVALCLPRRCRLPRGKVCPSVIAANIAREVRRDVAAGAVIVAGYVGGFATKFGGDDA